MKLSLEGEESVGMQVGPLIDVVFLLIIFFLLATVFKVERRLTSPLPGVATREMPKEIPKQILINVTADKRVLIHKAEYDSPESTDLPQLRAMLKEFAQLLKEPVVIVFPEQDVAYERVINVLDACRAANIKKISFAAEAIHPK